jgi:hypothetical protein
LGFTATAPPSQDREPAGDAIPEGNKNDGFSVGDMDVPAYLEKELPHFRRQWMIQVQWTFQFHVNGAEPN